MREEYNISLPLSDGIIFRKIRQYEIARNRPQTLKWRSRLSQSKRRDLKQLRTQKNLIPLQEAFDALLDFPGLWRALEIGTFHRILPMKCPVVSACYIFPEIETDFLLGAGALSTPRQISMGRNHGQVVYLVGQPFGGTD
jgi:hypothetical protein